MMTQPATGRAARLEDVAALAGVSTATASKALHNKPRISEETKQRVLDAAKQLNYSPNKLAQSLARGTTGTIGLVTSDLQGRFSTPILIGAENELRAQSTSVLLANARGDAALERQHVEKLLSLKVDGLLIVQCETNPRPTLGHDWGVPLVYVYGPSTDPKDCSVTCDNNIHLDIFHINNGSIIINTAVLWCYVASYSCVSSLCKFIHHIMSQLS